MTDPFADYVDHDAVGLADLVRTGAVAPAELVAAAIGRIEALNPAVNAVVTQEFERAMARARSPLPDGPFRGVPFLIKDLAVIEGEPVSFGSVFFRDFQADLTDELMHRIATSGVVPLGRTNTSEFGLLPTTEPVLHGPTRNPWHLDHSAGGSSGGAAAAVASGMVPIAHASDGGGSIRIPASACGVFGLKPSRGRMPQRPRSSHDGLVAPLAVSRSVRDSAVLLDHLAGPVPGDLWWAPAPAAESFAAAAGVDPGRLRVAYSVHDFRGVPVHPDCAAAVLSTATLLESLGHDVVEASPTIDAETMAVAFLKVWASFADTVFRLILDEVDKRPLGRAFHRVAGDWLSMRTLAKFDERKSGHPAFEPFTWAMAKRARRETPGGLAVAQGVLQGISYTMAEFLADYDVLVTPVLGTPPVRVGEIDQDMAFDDLVAQLVGYVAFTPVANFCGLPAMSVPLHRNADGLPIGTHIMGRFGEDDTLVSLAGQLERARPWWNDRPRIATTARGGRAPA